METSLQGVGRCCHLRTYLVPVLRMADKNRAWSPWCPDVEEDLLLHGLMGHELALEISHRQKDSFSMVVKYWCNEWPGFVFCGFGCIRGPYECLLTYVVVPSLVDGLTGRARKRMGRSRG